MDDWRFVAMVIDRIFLVSRLVFSHIQLCDRPLLGPVQPSMLDRHYVHHPTSSYALRRKASDRSRRTFPECHARPERYLVMSQERTLTFILFKDYIYFDMPRTSMKEMSCT